MHHECNFGKYIQNENIFVNELFTRSSTLPSLLSFLVLSVKLNVTFVAECMLTCIGLRTWLGTSLPWLRTGMSRFAHFSTCRSNYINEVMLACVLQPVLDWRFADYNYVTQMASPHDKTQTPTHSFTWARPWLSLPIFHCVWGDCSMCCTVSLVPLCLNSAFAVSFCNSLPSLHHPMLRNKAEKLLLICSPAVFQHQLLQICLPHLYKLRPLNTLPYIVDYFNWTIPRLFRIFD